MSDSVRIRTALGIVVGLLYCMTGCSSSSPSPDEGASSAPAGDGPTSDDGVPGRGDPPDTATPVGVSTRETQEPRQASTSEGVDDDLALEPGDEAPPAETAEPEPEPPVCVASERTFDAFDCGPNSIAFESNGPHENRVNYVIVGDGYTSELLDGLFEEHVTNMLSGTDLSMFTQVGEPYLRYRRFINVCGLKVVSNDACIDDRDTGQECDTAFDTNGDDASRLARLPQQGQARVLDEIEARVPADVDVSWIAMTVNAGANNWWNSGGRFMLWNGSYQPGSRSASVALHEGGHAFHGLADEYGGDGCGRNPSNPNVTDDPSGQKWSEWLGFDHGPDNPDGTGAQGTGAQGAFEGALYCNQGYYRPSRDSQMNLLPEPFNMVSIDRMVRDIYEIVRPIDAHTDDSETLDDPLELRVELVDPAVLKVDWLVDGEVVRENAGGCFDARSLAPGEHEVTAHAYDDTPWVRRDRENLEQDVTWQVRISAEP